jgi:putative transposase
MPTRHIDALREAVRKLRGRAPFHIDAWVVLPDHLHCIWTLPVADLDFSARWQGIKTAFSRQMPLEEFRLASRRGKGERGIWQRRFWEHAVRNDRDYAAHFDYVHLNPVKHKFVSRAADWPYSSFRRAVDLGIYPADWEAGGVPLGEAGER